MSVHVVFKCDGCDARTDPVRVDSRFVSLSGRSWGFGSWQPERIDGLAPEGWVAWDPYTGCCYCPECWKSICLSDKP